MATTLLRTRVERTRALKVGKILSSLGLKPNDAVNMLYAQIEQHRGLPFAVQEDGYAYAKNEYGLTPVEVDAAAKRIRRSIARERKAGTIKPVPATWQELRDQL